MLFCHDIILTEKIGFINRKPQPFTVIQKNPETDRLPGFERF